MGQFLHIHPGGAGEGEEADPAQDGRNKYSGKISTQYHSGCCVTKHLKSIAVNQSKTS